VGNALCAHNQNQNIDYVSTDQSSNTAGIVESRSIIRSRYERSTSGTNAVPESEDIDLK
jgi:hypothetical protein